VLKQKANGTDPFLVPSGVDTSNDPNIKNLLGVRFMIGFKARLGVPRVSNPSLLPDVVTLGGDTSSVIFNMLCSEFIAVELNPGSVYSSPSWTNLSQPANSPWVFTSKVDLRLSTVDGSAYSTLPPAVQSAIKNLEANAFSVQQLLFDLTNASLMTVPNLSGVTPGTTLYLILQQYFIGAYFTQMQKTSQPLLGCSVVMHHAAVSTLTLTNFDFEVSPYVDPTGHPVPRPTQDQQQLATLNYLCAADGKPLPPAVPFNWNWVDVSQLNDHDGTIAINRNTFANYFRNQLTPQVSRNCILPHVHVSLSGTFDTNVNYSWKLTPGQTPSITMPPTGKTVLSYYYSQSSDDSAGLNGDMGEFKLQPSYSLTVDFLGNTIVITQHLTVHMYVRTLATSGKGNIVDTQIVDTYTIGINAEGQLVADFKSNKIDHSHDPSVNAALNFFTNFNDISNDVHNKVQNFTGHLVKDIPLSTIQNYVFPGGRTFIFKSVGFSDYQDLVSFISYADPTEPMPTVATKPLGPNHL
jgi:hypothetical protein